MSDDTQTAINTIIWKSAPGAKWDILWLGDSNTAGFAYDEIEIAPHQVRSVLTCGLPGNGVAGLAAMVSSLNLFAVTLPKLVGIMIGTNDCLIANQASWLTPAAWTALYAQIVTAAFAAGAAVVCETYVLPEAKPTQAAIDAYTSTARLQALNQMVRGGAGSIHDQFYYPNPTRFALCDSQTNLAGGGAYSPAGSTLDGIHLMPATQRQRRGWWENTIAGGIVGI